ncbi:hypothetical protein DICPUDRAFT_91956, partial [Dictyostelium purpureum]
MEQPILSKYLQKYIVDIIVSNVNKENKQLSDIGESVYQLQNDFKDLEKVCWYWFELVSNGLNTISYEQLNNKENSGNEDSKYSIIKKENIKYLYLKRDLLCKKIDEDEDEDDGDNDEEGNEDPFLKSVILGIKNSISKYPNLKRIIINTKTNHFYKILNGLKKGNFDNIGSQTISKITTETETKTQPPSPKQIKISTPIFDYSKIVLLNSNIIVDKVISLNVFLETPQAGEAQSVKLLPFLQNLKQVKYFFSYGKLFQLLLKQIYNNPTTNKQE